MIKPAEMVLVVRPSMGRLLNSEICRFMVCIFDSGATEEPLPVGGVQSMLVHEFLSAEKLVS